MVMLKNNIRTLGQAIFSILLVLSLTGCLGGGSSSDSSNQEIVLGEGYDKKAGDVFTTSLTMDITFSNGQAAEINSISVSTYSQVNEIPSKYNYSNAISGPYLLETTNEDGVLDGLEYMTLSGGSIIDDDLDYYTNVEYTTQSGSDEPENIYIGDKFSFYQSSTLFNSQTGVEAGYKIINMEFSVISEEVVTVPAGVFNAVIIGYRVFETVSENNIINTSSWAGSGWFDITNGYMLKMTMGGDMTLSEHNLTASFSAETILENYFISPNGASGLVVGIIPINTLSNSEIKADSIFFGLKKGIRNIH